MAEAWPTSAAGRAGVVLLLCTLMVPALLAKPRAVRHPSVACSYSLLPTWGSGPVPAAGMERGLAFVYGQTSVCAQWGGYANVDWVTVEAAPLAAQPGAYVTVQANPLPEPRTAVLAIAGIRLDITQEAAPTFANTGLIQNGTFHAGIEQWGWPDRYPNGLGRASWSSIDGEGNPASGSILLHDDAPHLAFQRLQCVAVSGDTTYLFGAKVRTAEGADRGEGVLAVFEYSDANCEGDFQQGTIRSASPAQPLAWQEFSYTVKTWSRTRSMAMLIASSANVFMFDTWFDDVFVRERD